MRTYETVFIVRPDIAPDEVEKTLEFVKDNITKNGGEITKVEPWGKQNFAYLVDKHRDGHYFLLQFNASEEYPEELEKRYRYSEEILRHAIVLIDEKKFKLNPKKDPTPRPQRPRRDDRDDRRGPRRDDRRPPRRDDRDERPKPADASPAPKPADAAPAPKPADAAPAPAPAPKAAETAPAETPAEKKPTESAE